jgi:hypothetical protein
VASNVAHQHLEAGAVFHMTCTCCHLKVILGRIFGLHFQLNVLVGNLGVSDMLFYGGAFAIKGLMVPILNQTDSDYMQFKYFLTLHFYYIFTSAVKYSERSLPLTIPDGNVIYSYDHSNAR